MMEYAEGETSPFVQSVRPLTSPITVRVPPQFAAITIAEPYIMRSFVPLTSLCITTSIITVVERLSKFAEIMKVVTHKSHNNFVAFRVRSVLPKKLKHSLPFRTSVMPSVASKNKITSQASAMYLGNTLWATKELKVRPPSSMKVV